jgi:hypothetical protein
MNDRRRLILPAIRDRRTLTGYVGEILDLNERGPHRTIIRVRGKSLAEMRRLKNAMYTIFDTHRCGRLRWTTPDLLAYAAEAVAMNGSQDEAKALRKMASRIRAVTHCKEVRP